MSLRALITHVLPNPDLIGRMDIRESDVEPERRARHEQKLQRAREYLTERRIEIPAAYGRKGR